MASPCKNPKCGRFTSDGINYCTACLRAYEFGKNESKDRIKELQKENTLLSVLNKEYVHFLKQG